MLFDLINNVLTDECGILVALFGKTPVLAENGGDLSPGLGRRHGFLVVVRGEIVLAGQGVLAGNPVDEVQQLHRLRGRIRSDGRGGIRGTTERTREKAE